MLLCKFCYHHKPCKALAPLNECPKIFRENEGISSSGDQTRNSALSHSVIKK